MSQSLNPDADAHTDRLQHAEEAAPDRAGLRTEEEEEEEKVEQTDMHEERHEEASKDGRNGAGTGELAKREEGQKQEYNLDNFDQFEDAPNELEEKPANKLPVRQQIHSSQIGHEIQSEQKQTSKVSQEQQHQGEQEVQKTNENPIIRENQQKLEQRLSRVETQPGAPNRKSLQAFGVLSGKSSSLIRQAEKQRIGFTFGIFLKYNEEYQKIVSSHKFIIRNICSELASKHSSKKDLHASLIYYFETYIKIHREFYERSSKVNREQAMTSTTNKMANIREELKDGFELLFDVRKTLTNEMQKLEGYIINYTFKSMSEAFVTYQKQQKEEEKRQSKTVDEYQDAEKSFMKLFVELQKQFKKGMNGEKTKEDLFVLILKFINEETVYRQKLIWYGKAVLGFQKTFISSEKELFGSLQRIINEFKLESRKVLAGKKEEFCFTESYLSEIEAKCGFEQLCTITDVDYIKSVLELHNRKESGGLTDEQFESYLELSFFDHFVGNKQDLLKGAINKCFPLKLDHEELVHTISGNLVHFNRESDECKDRFSIKNLNAKVFAEGAVELEEVIKGFVFSENRTVRLQMASQDSAEELICYLNEMDQWKEGENKK